MRARDIMTRKVITVGPDTPVQDIARTLLKYRISAVPVINDVSEILGVVSEGDLMRRAESDTERPASWWLRFLSSPESRAEDYIRRHGRRAEEIMTPRVYTVDGDAPVNEVAEILESKRIKRAPVVHDGKLIGIVSRANLLHGLATGRVDQDVMRDDETLRNDIIKALECKAGVQDEFVNVTVSNGIVHLWGALLTESERHATRLVVENTDGVRAIEDHLSVLPPEARSTLWA